MNSSARKNEEETPTRSQAWLPAGQLLSALTHAATPLFRHAVDKSCRDLDENCGVDLFGRFGFVSLS